MTPVWPSLMMPAALLLVEAAQVDECVDGVHAGILGQCPWEHVEGVGEGLDGELLCGPRCWRSRCGGDRRSRSPWRRRGDDAALVEGGRHDVERVVERALGSSSVTCSVPPRAKTVTDSAVAPPVTNVRSSSPYFSTLTSSAAPMSLVFEGVDAADAVGVGGVDDRLHVVVAHAVEGDDAGLGEVGGDAVVDVTGDEDDVDAGVDERLGVALELGLLGLDGRVELVDAGDVVLGVDVALAYLQVGVDDADCCILDRAGHVLVDGLFLDDDAPR